MNIFRFRQDKDSADDAGIDEVIEGERDAAEMRRGLRLQSKLTNLLIVAGVVGVAGLALWRYYAAIYDRHQAATGPSSETVAAVPATLPPLKTPVFQEARQEAPLPAMPAAAQAALPAGPAVQAGSVGTTGIASGPRPLTPAQERMRQRLESPLAFKLADSQGPRQATGGGVDGMVPGGTAPSGQPAPDRAGHQLRGTGSRAYMLADPGMMITQGTRIPCNVVEALDTTLPGLVTCIQAEDVRSADGRVVLLERGTKWVGEQANGIAQGQRRVGIVWARGETPNHVLVDVDSGGADWLGRPGIAGEVDNHFWDRFGAAILLSVIGDVGPYLTALRQGGGSNNTTIAFPNITGGAQRVMSDVLKSSLDIPPTLTAPEASRIVIHVARDLDFRDVYALRERPTATR
ncbi:TrbI/VirB10 family protein [uncultured Massilia sp.]|uniref:TrbI/VirB10 family protein n=1 Tax=uncultured Massilia sp. TaxID=169973 RepID=UPI0025CD0534|nr:TrbI/VirB10 family protein [uncultured Massilia sp.]